MTSIWAFCVLFFVLYEAIYPAELDFIFFFLVLKTIFINVSKNPEKTQTTYLYT